MAVEAEPGLLFGVTVIGTDGDPVIRVAGEIDLASAPYLRDGLAAGIAATRGPVTVDLGEVSFMDSTGLSVLIMAHKRLARDGRQLRLRSPSPEVTRVINLSGLIDVFHMSG